MEGATGEKLRAWCMVTLWDKFKAMLRQQIFKRHYKIAAIILLSLMIMPTYTVAQSWLYNLISTQSILQTRPDEALSQSPDYVCQQWTIGQLTGDYNKGDKFYAGADGYCRIWLAKRLNNAFPIHKNIYVFATILVIVGVLLEALEKTIPRHNRHLFEDNPTKDLTEIIGLIFLVEGLVLEIILAIGSLNFLDKPYEYPKLSEFFGHLNFDQARFLPMCLGLLFVLVQVGWPILKILRSPIEEAHQRSEHVTGIS